LKSIYEIWLRVSEDFAPFNVNVTTSEPSANALIRSSINDASYGVRVCIGGSSSDWYGEPVGGIAYLGSFLADNDTPAYVFPKNLSLSTKYVAEAVSHEVGHTLGLEHDGRLNGEYYSGADGWAPIMGSGANMSLRQWSKGEYSAANNAQDDLVTITSFVGVNNDDCGDDINGATPISLASEGVIVEGVVGVEGDVDVYKFDYNGEKIALTIGGINGVTNLDVLATLYDKNGVELKTYDTTDELSATVALAGLTKGTYYLSVQGTGLVQNGKTIYTSYGSLGAYSIKANAFKYPTLVTTELDVVDPTDELVSLREALSTAEQGETITFASNLRGKTIALGGSALSITTGVTIDASSLASSGTPKLRSAAPIFRASLKLAAVRRASR